MTSTIWSSLVRENRLQSGSYVMIRPGLTLRLSYPEPIQKLGPYVAEVIQQYLEFIRPESLHTYLASNGTWKSLSPATLKRNLTELRAVPKKYEFVEYHYGHGQPAHVGQYGLHFTGSNLAGDTWPLEENLLLLEFPHDFIEQRSPEPLVEFAAKVASGHPFGSGSLGYSFRHLHLTHTSQAYEEIARMAPRFIGFDIDSERARLYSRGRLYNVSWVTLLGVALVERLGGVDGIRAALPAPLQVGLIDTGVLVRAAERPIIGDVNQGAEDAAPLRALAALTRGVRVDAPSLGPTGDFAERWLSRFDP